MNTYLICGLLIGGVLAFAIGIGAWAYKDANNRGMDGTVWALVVVFTGGFGVGLYLGTRMAKKSPFGPPLGHTQQGQYPSSETYYAPMGQRFCTECGGKLTPGFIECQRCGSRIKHQPTHRIKK